MKCEGNWYWNGAFPSPKMKHIGNISWEGCTKGVEIRPGLVLLYYNCDPPIRMDVHTYVTYLNNDLRFRCRNPNVIDHHGRNDTLLPASREKSRGINTIRCTRNTWRSVRHRKRIRSKFLFTPFPLSFLRSPFSARPN